MQLSMWTYAWDVQDQGSEKMLSELCDSTGLNTISLATSYHAGRFLQPRSPSQKAYFPEDGTIYYVPDQALWHGKIIRPLVASNACERGDMLERLIAEREKGGPQVSCWTVCLHNTRLGMKHPQHVTRNAFGNPNYYNLCPSSPAARDYVATMAQDVSSRYKPDMIELESPTFMGFVHGYHHEKDAVGINAEDDFLLSLCFCEHCMYRAGKAGVDTGQARADVRSLISDMCEREIPEKQFPDFETVGIDVFKAYPELHGFLNWRYEPVTSLIAQIREATDPDTRVVLIDLEDGWRGGVDLEAVGEVCDGAILCCYSMDPDQVNSLITEGRLVLGSDKYLGAGYRLFYPEMSSAQDLVERTMAAFEVGIDDVHFYNYGLIPKKRLDWIRAAVNAME